LQERSFPNTRCQRLFDFDNALLNFLSTLSGVLVAFGLTLWYDRRRRRQIEKESQQRIAKGILQELRGNLKFVQDSKGKGILATLFPAGVYQSAKSSGDLSLFSPEMQRALSIIYTEFEVVERFGARVLSMAGSSDMRIPEFAKNFEAFNQLVANQLSELETRLPGVIEAIEAELKELDS
jgi:hypothetical protein